MRLPIKWALLETGRRQVEVARAAGLSEARMSKITNGWLEPRPEERERIAAALGRPADELFEASR